MTLSKFAFNPEDGLLNVAQYPTTPETSPDGISARTQVQDPMNQIRDHINDTLIPELTGYGATYAESSTGTDAYAVTITDFPDAYAAGQRVTFKADVANTGACTLKVNGLAAVAIKRDDGTDPADGDIQAGAVVTVVYDGTVWKLQMPGVIRHLAESAAKHITESGSNANGEYIRFDDGTQICWFTATLDYDSTERLKYIWTYPASFSGTPTVKTTQSGSDSGYTPGPDELGINHALAVSTTGCTIYQYRQRNQTNFASGDTCLAHIEAIGRWK